jgi:hypothetical protein
VIFSGEEEVVALMGAGRGGVFKSTPLIILVDCII